MPAQEPRFGLRAFWTGAVPLPVAFWRYGIFYGTLINGAATLAALLLIAAAQVPGWLAVVVYFLPLPYNVSILVAVWNSADRWPGRPLWAELARWAIVAWTIGVTAL